MPALDEHRTFGPFHLDPPSSLLIRDGVEIEIRPQAFQALLALLEQSGQYVNYEQMIRSAWDGVLVSRHTVAVTVGEVKKCLREYGCWITYRPKLGYRLDVPRSDDLIRRGNHFWYQHTREGFERAISCFEKAIHDAPGDWRGYQGLGSTYLMLATYGMEAPHATYDLFLEAHANAAALGGMTPELRADRAQGLHVFERRFDEAEAELLLALRERPRLPAVLFRLAMLYAAQARWSDALDALARVHPADSLCPLLGGAEILIHTCARDYEAAIACGKRQRELHPYYQLSRFFYAEALEAAGYIEEALAEYRAAAVISPDLLWLRAMEGTCLAQIGRIAEAEAICRELEGIRSTRYLDSYHFALLHESLGRVDQAFVELERACDENSSTLHMIDVDPKFDTLREDPRFTCIRDRVFESAKLAIARAS